MQIRPLGPQRNPLPVPRVRDHGPELCLPDLRRGLVLQRPGGRGVRAPCLGRGRRAGAGAGAHAPGARPAALPRVAARVRVGHRDAARVGFRGRRIRASAVGECLSRLLWTSLSLARWRALFSKVQCPYSITASVPPTVMRIIRSA